MSLPTSRNTTYSTDGPIKSIDLNDIQDQLIAFYLGRRSTRTISVPLTSISTALPGVTSSVDTQYIQCPLEIGARIHVIRAVIQGDPSGGQMQCALVRSAAGDVSWSNVSGPGSPSVGVNTIETITHSGINHVVASGFQYAIAVSYFAGAGPSKVFRGEFDVGHD